MCMCFISTVGWGERAVLDYRLALYFYIFFYKFSYLTQPYPLENRLGGGAGAGTGGVTMTMHSETIYFYRLTQTEGSRKKWRVEHAAH